MFTKYASATIMGYADSSKGKTASMKTCGSFEYEPRSDHKYLYVAARACTADVPNLNYDMLPDRELKTAYETFKGSYVYLNHDNTDPRKARGAIIDAKYHTEDENDKWVEILMELDEEKAPKLCSLIRSGEIDTVSMGCSVANTECSICGNVAEYPFEYCKHIEAKGQEYGGKLAYEICNGIEFFEESFVYNPADPTAHVKGLNEETEIKESAKKQYIASRGGKRKNQKAASKKTADVVSVGFSQYYVDGVSVVVCGSSPDDFDIEIDVKGGGYRVFQYHDIPISHMGPSLLTEYIYGDLKSIAVDITPDISDAVSELAERWCSSRFASKKTAQEISGFSLGDWEFFEDADGYNIWSRMGITHYEDDGFLYDRVYIQETQEGFGAWVEYVPEDEAWHCWIEHDGETIDSDGGYKRAEDAKDWCDAYLELLIGGRVAKKSSLSGDMRSRLSDYVHDAYGKDYAFSVTADGDWFISGKSDFYTDNQTFGCSNGFVNYAKEIDAVMTRYSVNKVNGWNTREPYRDMKWGAVAVPEQTWYEVDEEHFVTTSPEFDNMDEWDDSGWGDNWAVFGDVQFNYNGDDMWWGGVFEGDEDGTQTIDEDCGSFATKEEAQRAVENALANYGIHVAAFADAPKRPDEVDTQEDERVCPLCGSESFDGEYCSVCGYQEPPEGMGDIEIDDEDEVEDIDLEEAPEEDDKEKTAGMEVMYDIADDPQYFINVADEAGGDYILIGFDIIKTDDVDIQYALEDAGAIEM